MTAYITGAPTQHVWPPSTFAIAGPSVRLEQSSGPCSQSKLHRSCFQTPAKDISVQHYTYILTTQVPQLKTDVNE